MRRWKSEKTNFSAFFTSSPVCCLSRYFPTSLFWWRGRYLNARVMIGWEGALLRQLGGETRAFKRPKVEE